MRVLWFTNIPMPEFSRHLGNNGSVKGGWMPSLAEAIRKEGGITLGIASCTAGHPCSQANIDGTFHFNIPLQFPTELDSQPTEATIKRCREIVDEFKPDVIHIHGTEKYFGLLTARGHITIPAVISIQGLIHACARHYFGGLSITELLRANTLADIRVQNGLINQKISWHKRSALEREIIAGNKVFIGRTRWDRAHLRAINPDAKYFHCDELLRLPFYDYHWHRNACRPFTVFAPTGSYPLKGLHWLLKAAAILKREFPELKLRIADGDFAMGLKGKSFMQRMKMSGYQYLLARMVDELHLHNVIQLVGQLTAGQMAEEISKAHVAVFPSVIENSPNSLCESMLIGTPCAVSFAGGMTSLVEDRKSALCFSACDEAEIAECVRTVFLDDALAEQLSREAIKSACIRHDKQTIVKTTLSIYNSLCK